MNMKLVQELVWNESDKIWTPAKYPVRLNLDSILRIRDAKLDGNPALEVRDACGTLFIAGTYSELFDQ